MTDRFPFLPDVLRTGILEIDEQHHGLFQQANDIEKACIEHNALRQEDADALLERLRQHFVTEERFASGAGVDFSAHGKRHEEMYRTIAAALERALSNTEGVFGLVRYLQYWFERHIVQDDLPLGRAVSNTDDAISSP